MVAAFKAQIEEEENDDIDVSGEEVDRDIEDILENDEQACITNEAIADFEAKEEDHNKAFVVNM